MFEAKLWILPALTWKTGPILYIKSSFSWFAGQEGGFAGQEGGFAGQEARTSSRSMRLSASMRSPRSSLRDAARLHRFPDCISGGDATGRGGVDSVLRVVVVSVPDR